MSSAHNPSNYQMIGAKPKTDYNFLGIHGHIVPGGEGGKTLTAEEAIDAVGALFQGLFALGLGFDGGLEVGNWADIKDPTTCPGCQLTREEKE